MRHYHIYLLKEDVAYDYFGKEQLIFELFFEQRNEKDSDYKQLLNKQIHYITTPFSVINLKRFIEKHLHLTKNPHSELLQFTYRIRSKHIESVASLEIFPRYLSLTSEGSYDAETVFFEVLRKYNPFFLAMDFERYNFGWLNPIKQKHYI